METIISGLTREACLGALHLEDDALLHTWLSPDDFFRISEATFPQDECPRLIWAYVPPWFLHLDDHEGNCTDLHFQTLADWLVAQRAALTLRKKIGHKLTVVNFKSVNPSFLQAYLTGRSCPTVSGSPEAAPHSADYAVLARLFEWIAPEYWDTFETLEAISWLPQGTPQFRANFETPDQITLIKLMQCLHDGKVAPALRNQLRAAETKLDQVSQVNSVLNQDKAALEARIHVHVTDNHAISSERNQLLQQLSIVQEELESVCQRNKKNVTTLEKERAQFSSECAASLRKLAEVEKQLMIAKAKSAQDRKTLIALTSDRDLITEKEKNVATKLTETTKILSATQSQRKADIKKLTERNVSVERQLHRIQTELEQYYLVNREMQAVMSNSAQTMHAARGLLTTTLLNV